MEKKWFSHREYGMSPMPSAIFFHEGYAIHGTIYVAQLGQRASHGCVRLHPDNAAKLFDLVRGEGMGATSIVISNTSHVAVRPPAAPKVEAQALPPRETTAKAQAVEAEAMPAKTVEPSAPELVVEKEDE